MASSATKLVLIVVTTMLTVTGVLATGAMAQERMSGGTIIHRRNTDIVFENAGISNLPSARYQAFDQFASEHPEIARTLAHNPRLIEDETFINRHPRLADFLRTHSGTASDFAENPGNYVNMPLTVEASIKKHPIER